MNWQARICWLILALLVGACSEAKERPEMSKWQGERPLDCHAELSASEVSLLAPLQLTVRVLCDARLELPFMTQIPAGFTGEASTSVVASGEAWLHTVEFRLRPTELGKLKIEPIKIEHDGETVTTPVLWVEVVSALGASDDRKQVEGQATLLPEPVWWPYLVGAIGLLFLVILVWWWRRRPRRAVRLPVEVPVPAHVKALRALQCLQSPSTEPEIDAFYVAVSQILRVYLEERFGLHAPTRSTEEFLGELERGASLGLGHRQSLRNFLQQCDLVKFAQLLPDAGAHQQTLQVASTVVEETRPDLAPGGAA